MQRTVLLSQFCRPSDACIVTKLNDALRIFWYHTKRQSLLVFWLQHWLVSNAPFPVKYSPKVTHPYEKRRLRPISAYNISTVRDSEKHSIMTNIKLTTGFPTSEL